MYRERHPTFKVGAVKYLNVATVFYLSFKEFKTAVVFELSMFEAQKVYCNSQHCATMLRQRNFIIQKNKQIK